MVVVDAGVAGDAAMQLGFRFGEESFVVEVADGALTARRGDPASADVIVSAPPEAVAAVVYGGVPAASLAIKGRVDVFERFTTFFALPAKAD